MVPRAATAAPHGRPPPHQFPSCSTVTSGWPVITAKNTIMSVAPAPTNIVAGPILTSAALPPVATRDDGDDRDRGRAVPPPAPGQRTGRGLDRDPDLDRGEPRDQAEAARRGLRHA